MCTFTACFSDLPLSHFQQFDVIFPDKSFSFCGLLMWKAMILAVCIFLNHTPIYEWRQTLPKIYSSTFFNQLQTICQSRWPVKTFRWHLWNKIKKSWKWRLFLEVTTLITVAFIHQKKAWNGKNVKWQWPSRYLWCCLAHSPLRKWTGGIFKKEPNNILLLPRSVPHGTLQIIETFFILTIIIKTSRWRQ